MSGSTAPNPPRVQSNPFPPPSEGSTPDEPSAPIPSGGGHLTSRGTLERDLEVPQRPDPDPSPLPPGPSDGGADHAGPSGGRHIAQRIIAWVPALIPLAILCLIVWTLVRESNLATFNAFEFFGPSWNPDQSFGVLYFIVGSLITSVPALFFAMLIAIGVAIASAIYLPRAISRMLDPFIDLLAGIPSIVFGLWGVIILAPYFATVLTPWMSNNLYFLPGFAGPVDNPLGEGIPLAVFILTLMILPITTLMIRDSLRRVPKDLWESGLALGATRWEVTRRISLRYAARGIWAAGLLGFSRAMGEAIAVSLVIGDATKLPTNVYSSSDTLAAALVQNADQAFIDPAFLTALAEIALLLTAITLTVNLLGRHITSQLAASGIVA